MSVPDGWRQLRFDELAWLQYGKALQSPIRSGVGTPVFGSSGIVGFHSAHLVKGPVAIIGRKGNAGAVYFSSDDCWPIDTTYYVEVRADEVSAQFIALWCEAARLEELRQPGARPGLNRDLVHALLVAVPPREEQQAIMSLVGSFDSALSADLAAARHAAHLLACLREDLVEGAGVPRVSLGEALRNIEAGRSPRAEDRPPSAGERAVLKVSAVKPGRFVWSEAKTLPVGTVMPPDTDVRRGDLLMARANANADNVGAVCKVPEDFPHLFLCD